MRVTCKLATFCLLLICGNSYAIEITPLYGFRFGGDFEDETNQTDHTVVNSGIYGLLISFPYERGKTLELYYSHQSSDVESVQFTNGTITTETSIPLDIDYLHIGGTAPISEDKELLTFVSGGLGFTHLNPKLAGAQSELRPSMSLGIGLKWPITENIAIRLETRGFATFFNNNSTLFCNGGCELQVQGNGFFQGEVFSGLAIRF